MKRSARTPRTRSILVAAALVALCASAEGGATEVEPTPATQALVNRLQSAYDRLETLRAEFVQTLHTVALAEPQEERGILYLRRPSLMRWEYQMPETKLAVVDGARTWLYIPAENQVIVGDLAEVHRSGAAGLLLAGTVDLTRDFEIRPGPEEDKEGPGTAVLTLTPRRPSGEFDRIDITVSLETDLPVRIRVHAPLGDVMEYRLAGVRTGMPLEPSLFQFQPPEGVEVVLAD